MPKILVVDDKSTNRKLLKTVLTKDKDTKDYEVIEAGSGKAALEAVKNDPPDIILLDIMMPEMDGFEVCTELKEDPQYNAIPILFITAMEKVEEKVKGFEVGAADYITKPINQKEVKARVKAHLRIREAEDERLQAESLKTIKDMIVTYNHEMSQPLTAIQGHADLLMSDAEEDDENYDSYKTILEQSERVIKILNKIKSLETAEN
jgi:DNA-binding response OmpR family regulator